MDSQGKENAMLKNSGFIPAEACGLHDDVILLCLALSTTPRNICWLPLRSAFYLTSGPRRGS